MGLGYARFQVARDAGVDTIKPDVHLHNFVKGAPRPLLEQAVSVLESIAQKMGIKASQLDSMI